MRAGARQKIRNVPIHTLVVKLNPEICETLVAAHHLTGADYTSKVGTKKSAIAAEPSDYLLDFGRGNHYLLFK